MEKNALFKANFEYQVRLDAKIRAPVDVDSRVIQGSVLGSLLFILYTSEFFHIVGNHIAG